ncbi:MAG: 50S ribosomal protein L32 [Saprospiraceae bacterium]|nr:50S ribosomal protein L32 [Saprospiraceae bacterium]
MAHPKSRISKQRKRKRRTHYKSDVPNVVKCPTTGEPHLRHHAYEVDGNIYYRGKLFIAAEEA